MLLKNNSAVQMFTLGEEAPRWSKALRPRSVFEEDLFFVGKNGVLRPSSRSSPGILTG